MTVNLSIRNYSIAIAGLDCTDALVSFSGSDSKLDQSGLITFTGSLVLGVPQTGFESLDDRKNSRWDQGNPIALRIADSSGALRPPPRGGSVFILESSYSPKTRRLTIRFGDWLSLAKAKEAIGNASKICLGTSTAKSTLIGRLLTAAGVPETSQSIAVPGGISAPAPRLLEGSYIDQAGQVAASSGYFLYVDSAGVVCSRAIDAATISAQVVVRGDQVVQTERVAGQLPATQIRINARCSVTKPAKDAYTAYSEQRGPAFIAGTPFDAVAPSTDEIVLRRTYKRDSFDRGSKTRTIVNEISQCVGILFPDDEQLAGDTRVLPSEVRIETHTYEANTPLTATGASARCQQGNQGRLLRTLIQVYRMRGVVLREILSGYPEEAIGDKTALMLAEQEETTYQYDLGHTAQIVLGVSEGDDWTVEALGDGPQIVTRKFQPVAVLCGTEFAYGSDLDYPERMVEYAREVQTWTENHLGEWEHDTQTYQSLVLESSTAADALRQQLDEQLDKLVDALVALSVGDDSQEFSNSGQTQPPAPTTYPAAFTVTEKTVRSLLKLPTASVNGYRQPEQALSFEYLNSTSPAAAQGDADRLAQLWGPILWGRYKSTSYTTDLADDWWNYAPLARIDAEEAGDRFAYLGDGFALAMADKRCVVSFDGLLLGYLGAGDGADSASPIAVETDPIARYLPGAVSLVPPEVVTPYLPVRSLQIGSGSAANLSYRGYTLDPVVKSLRTVSAEAARLTLVYAPVLQVQAAAAEAASSRYEIKVNHVRAAIASAAKLTLKMGPQFSNTIVSLKGSAGMTLIMSVPNDDANTNLGDFGFDFQLYGVTYRNNIYIGSNSYITFGFGSSQYSNITPTSPGVGLLIGAADRSWLSVYTQKAADNSSFRVRWEGGMSSSPPSTPTSIWEATFWANGVIQLVTGSAIHTGGTSCVTSGQGTFNYPAAYTSFTLNPDTSWVFTPNDTGTNYTVRLGSYG